MTHTKEILRAADLAPMLGVSRSRIYQLLASRELPAIRIGRAIWIPVSALNEWLHNQKEKALAEVRVAGDKAEGGDL